MTNNLNMNNNKLINLSTPTNNQDAVVMSKLSIFVMSELNVYQGVLSCVLCLTQVVKWTNMEKMLWNRECIPAAIYSIDNM